MHRYRKDVGGSETCAVTIVWLRYEPANIELQGAVSRLLRCQSGSLAKEDLPTVMARML